MSPDSFRALVDMQWSLVTPCLNKLHSHKNCHSNIAGCFSFLSKLLSSWIDYIIHVIIVVVVVVVVFVCLFVVLIFFIFPLCSPSLILT